MILENINKNIWSEIPKSEKSTDGYLGFFINHANQSKLDLLIFRDENNKKHFVIEINSIKGKEIADPNVNGLRIDVKQFRFNDMELKSFIDLECSLDDYLEEFTEIIKAISTEILIHNQDAVASVNCIIENWKSFWDSRVREILSEEDQVGLLCELIILELLCNINPSMALTSWRGPLGEKHDFVFSDWGFEVKGTRSSKHLHWINGIDQLKKSKNKDLAFVSFLVTMSKSKNSISIQSLIFTIVTGPLKNKPLLIQNFYSLLISAGYSKVFAEEYEKYCFDIIDCLIFHVDESFPKFTSEDLNKPLSNRVSEIRYKIDLQGLKGENMNGIQMGNYFY